MRHLRLPSITAVVAAAALAVPATTAADPTGICPSDFFLVPAFTAPEKDKDRNDDGFVCVKPTSPERQQTDADITDNVIPS